MMRNGQLDQLQAEHFNNSRYDSMPMTSKLIREIDEDSDDMLGGFDSNNFGAGTSKAIAQHYNTVG